MQLGHYIGLLHRSEHVLGDAFREVGEAHAAEVDVQQICLKLAGQCDEHARRLDPFVTAYRAEGDTDDEPDRLHGNLFGGTREGPLALLRDLHDLYLLASECDLAWTLVGQGAQGARDEDLLAVVQGCEGETAIQLSWLRTRMKQAAPQALVVA